MSKRTLIGHDYQSAGCLKIMRDAAYDPFNTPDTDYAKFAFNSKDIDQYRFVGTDFATREATGEQQAIYYPPGSNANTYTRVAYSGLSSTPTNNVGWTKDFFTGLSYSLPLHDMRLLRDGYYYNTLTQRVTYGYQDRAGETAFFGAREPGWMEGFLPGRAALGTVRKNLIGTNASTSEGFEGNFWGQRRLVVYNLPGDESPIASPAQAPVSGQMQVQIGPSMFRVSKPGYDVRTATPSQLAFDASSRPVKAIYAADIALPAGVTSIDLAPYLYGTPVTGELIADVWVYEAATGSGYYPTSPNLSNIEFGCYYRINGLTLEITNPYGACRARVVVIAQDFSAPSNGPNRVFRQFFDGTQDVVQILRPGAAAVPTLSDIIVDSRWPAIRIIKEGYFAINGNGSLAIPFDSSGLFPIIKYMTVHGAGTMGQNGQFLFSPIGGDFTRRIRMPIVRTIYATGRAFQTASDTTYCQLTGTQAVFHWFKSNFWRYYSEKTSTTPGYRITTDTDQNPPLGIRYFIMGIPA